MTPLMIDLADYYFVPLRACILHADVGAFMCSYNAINGTGSCGNQWMLQEVCRPRVCVRGCVRVLVVVARVYLRPI